MTLVQKNALTSIEEVIRKKFLNLPRIAKYYGQNFLRERTSHNFLEECTYKVGLQGNL
jgi:hypothetical protein